MCCYSLQEDSSPNILTASLWSVKMGFVVDMENMSNEECEHILRVIRQDFLLRENDRFKLR